MSTIFRHPAHPEMQAEVILASCCPSEPEAPTTYTIRLRHPCMFNGEAVFGALSGARSSRTVPVETMLDEVRQAAFVPWHWGKNRNDSQAGEECIELLEDLPWVGGDEGAWSRKHAWIHLASVVVDTAEIYARAGYDNRISEYLLDPFSWVDTLITSTEWDEFLRASENIGTDPHLQDLARLVKQAMDSAPIQELEPGEWHLPYIARSDRSRAAIRTETADECNQVLSQISAARCDRISFKPSDGDTSCGKELERYEQLAEADRLHAFPIAHKATADDQPTEHDRQSGGLASNAIMQAAEKMAAAIRARQETYVAAGAMPFDEDVICQMERNALALWCTAVADQRKDGR